MQEVVVTNTSPIINLSKINRLDLLQLLYKTIYIPAAVYKEIMIKPNSLTAIQLKGSLEWIKVLEISRRDLIPTFENGLHLGEIEAILLSMELRAKICILDDNNAKKYANKLGLKVTGTVGILTIAKESGYIPAIKPYLESLVSSGMYLSSNVIKEVLELANEL